MLKTKFQASEPSDSEFEDFYAPEGTSDGILKSQSPSVRLSVRPSVTNRVSAISHKLLKQI